MPVTLNAPAPCANEQPEQDNSVISRNGLMAILMSLLQHIEAQGDTIRLGVEREELLKSAFDEQKAVVQAEQKKLNDLIKESAEQSKADPKNMEKQYEYLHKIQAQTAQVQAEESKLSYRQNNLVEEFKVGIAPAQKLIENDSNLFGGVLHTLIKSENTRSKNN